MEKSAIPCFSLLVEDQQTSQELSYRRWRQAAKQILVEFENLVGRGDGLIAPALPVLDVADQRPRPVLGPGASSHGRWFRPQDGADLGL